MQDIGPTGLNEFSFDYRGGKPSKKVADNYRDERDLDKSQGDVSYNYFSNA